MPIRPLSTWKDVGHRVASARVATGLTQAQLANSTGLERTALAKIEAGTRGLSSLELAKLAHELGRSLEWFVSEAPPAVVSRRQELFEGRDDIGVHVDAWARDVELLLEVRTLKADERTALTFPDSLNAAESAASAVRRELQLEDDPIYDLGAVTGLLGMHVLATELPECSADGAYVALEGAGACVINSDRPAGRRRFTLAHELGHHVFADEYSTDIAVGESRDNRERLINAFAVHLLLPGVAVRRSWERLGGDVDERRAALALAVDYRVSWSAACSQLANLNVVSKDLAEHLRQQPPGKRDLVELGRWIVEELSGTYISPLFAQATLKAYRSGRIASGRAIELLRGTLDIDDLPSVDPVPLDALKGEVQ